MNKENIAISQSEVGKVCCKCLTNERYINNIKIPMGGYESEFDNFQTQLDLCDICKNETPELFLGDYINHEFEKEIWNLIRTFPLAGRELFENRYAYGACAHTMESQDWIDYELKILSHEKCKEYGMYSHQERQAYADRFSKCGNVFLKVWGDGSSGRHCPYGANDSVSSKCYMCEHFKLREEEMKTINVEDEFYKREIIRTEESIKHFENYLKKLNNKEVNEYDIY